MDSLETGPSGGDLASDLVLGATKSIFNGPKLDRDWGSSLESSLGWSWRTWDTSDKFTVLLDWVEAVLDVSQCMWGVSEGTYFAYTLVVLEF